MTCPTQTTREIARRNSNADLVGDAGKRGGGWIVAKSELRAKAGESQKQASRSQISKNEAKKKTGSARINTETKTNNGEIRRCVLTRATACPGAAMACSYELFAHGDFQVARGGLLL
jgi:hypothetical protein